MDREACRSSLVVFTMDSNPGCGRLSLSSARGPERILLGVTLGPAASRLLEKLLVLTLLLCSLLLDAVRWPVLRWQVCDGDDGSQTPLCACGRAFHGNLPRHRRAAPLIRCAGDFVRNSVGLKH